MKKKYLFCTIVLSLTMLLGACSSQENVRGTVSGPEQSTEKTEDKDSSTPEKEQESLPASQQEEEPSISLGTSSNNVYENSFLGIGCTLDDQWTFASDEEILANNQMTKDMIGEEYKEVLESAAVINDMLATHSNGMNTVNINLEKLPLTGLAITEEQYCQASSANLESALANMGLEISSVQVSSLEFAGKEHACIKVEGSYSGVKVYETLVAFKQGSYISCITACSWYEDTTLEILSAFYAL